MHSFRAQKVVENANQSDFLSAMHSFRAQKVVENATHWKKINIRFKGLPFQAFLPSLAFLPCPFYHVLQPSARVFGSVRFWLHGFTLGISRHLLCVSYVTPLVSLFGLGDEDQ